jgi:hypothetical protein
VATIAAALFGCDGERGRKRKEKGGGSHRRDLRRDHHLTVAGGLHCWLRKKEGGK